MTTSDAGDGPPPPAGLPGLRSALDENLERLGERLAEFARAQERMHGLLEAILAISGELELPVVLRRIVSTAMDLANARYGALGVLDEEGSELAEFIPVGLSEEERERLAGVALPHGEGLLGQLITDPRPLRTDDIPGHPQAAGFPPGHPPMRTLLGVAISVRGKIYGNLYLTDRQDGKPFDQDDEAVVIALAGAAGVAIENARLYGQLRAGAEQFQRLLLPRLPDLTPFSAWAMYQPAADPRLLGGDWYDALLLPDGTVVLIVGDVVGHDVRAAAAMAQIRNMLRALAFDSAAPPGELLSRLDRALAAFGDPTMATVCLARIQPAADGWSLWWSSAGHPAPLVVTADGRTVRPDEEAGVPLGVDPSLPRQDHCCPLPPGATVLMFTDGLVERPDLDPEVAVDQVARAAAAHADRDPEPLGRAVVAARPSDDHDDMALLVVRVPGVD
ncbi:PP2C family protein-serine/threonine phosphatase [Streptomyces sp. NPDC052396]|uniref:PP2C family protein-serine/threonine phosphatase n=1 Tax=Streptomyces sp. NPDC052396 TaxID=3365689 RepID=UPI0037D577DA